MPDERFLQDAARNLEAGSTERQVKARFAATFSAFRKRRLAVWAAGRGPDPSLTAMVFWCCGSGLGPRVAVPNGR